MKLSIIVPIYNVEKYIEKCILSLVNQDFSDYEIIVVNDGSPDESASIVNELKKKYPNILLFHKKNGGLSSARNFGLTKAKGEYVWFVDSDDWIESNIISLLYKHVKEFDLDCLWFDHNQINENNKIIYSSKDSNSKPSNTILNGDVFLRDIFQSSCYVCMFWFKTNWLRTINFKFTEGILYEDLEIIPSTLLKARKIQYQPIIVYNYLVRKGSILNSYNPQRVSSYLIALNRNICLYKNNVESLKKIVTSSIIGLLKMTSHSNYINEKENVFDYLDQIDIKLQYVANHTIEVFVYNVSYRLLFNIYRFSREIKDIIHQLRSRICKETLINFLKRIKYK